MVGEVLVVVLVVVVVVGLVFGAVVDVGLEFVIMIDVLVVVVDVFVIIGSTFSTTTSTPPINCPYRYTSTASSRNSPISARSGALNPRVAV